MFGPLGEAATYYFKANIGQNRYQTIPKNIFMKNEPYGPLI